MGSIFYNESPRLQTAPSAVVAVEIIQRRKRRQLGARTQLAPRQSFHSGLGPLLGHPPSEKTPPLLPLSFASLIWNGEGEMSDAEAHAGRDPSPRRRVPLSVWCSLAAVLLHAFSRAPLPLLFMKQAGFLKTCFLARPSESIEFRLRVALVTLPEC